EPPSAENPLFKVKDKLILTPHQGASTAEAQARVALEIAVNVAEYFTRGIVRGGVNLPAHLDPAVLERRAAQVTLSEHLGSFLGQMEGGAWTKVTLACAQAYDEKERKVFLSAALRGLLNCVLGDKVNIVNADRFAADRGIDIAQSSHEHSAELTLTVQRAGAESISVSGRVEPSGQVKLSRLGDLVVDVVPQGNLLIIENIDRPGVIGSVGTLLGACGVNIADMRVGRKRKLARAVMVLTVDDNISREVMARLAKIKGILRVSLVRF
ncbi:MAG: ACT domain-containing protein, partial [Elusimicrobiota bacterium]